MLPADAEVEPVELAEPDAPEVVLLVPLLLHAARAPGMAARLAVAASPLMAARRENAPDLAGMGGLSVMATPRGERAEGSGHSEDRTEHGQNVASRNMLLSRCEYLRIPIVINYYVQSYRRCSLTLLVKVLLITTERITTGLAGIYSGRPPRLLLQ